MSTRMETKIPDVVVDLAARILGAPYADLAGTQLSGDASTRSYFRVQAKDNSVVVALYSEPFSERETARRRLEYLESIEPAARLSFANDPCAHVEVTNLFAEGKLPVPRILAISGETGSLILEDVGDLRLQDWLITRPTDEALAAYETAVTFIVKIQELTSLVAGSDSICSGLAFDQAKLRWELAFFFDHYVNKYLRVSLDAAAGARIQKEFSLLCSELAARPRVLVHRDYHARNLMMRDSEMFIIDHQDARMGPASYDIASLLSDPYTGLEPQFKEKMIEHFISLKRSSPIPLDSEESFRTELDLMTIQRMLKAIGTYAYQAAVLNNSIYVAYIRPAIESALASINAVGQFDGIKSLLKQARA